MVKSPLSLREANHPAEHGIDFDVIVAARFHTKPDMRPLVPFPPGTELNPFPGKRAEKIAEKTERATVIFGRKTSAATSRRLFL